MIWRTGTRSSAEGFSSSSFSIGDGRTGSTNSPRIASSTWAFSGHGRSRLARPVEQVVVEAGVELRPGEDHQAHPAADELRPSRSACSGVGRGDVGQDEHVGGLEPGGEEVLLLDDLDPPGLRVADADRQGRGQVIDLRAERLRRRLAVDQADQQRVLHRHGRPALVVARQLVLGKLEREVVRARRREPDGQRDPRPSVAGAISGSGTSVGRSSTRRIALAPAEHPGRVVADHRLPAALGPGEDRPVERDERLERDVGGLVVADVHDPDADPLLAPAPGDRRDAARPSRPCAGR